MKKVLAALLLLAASVGATDLSVEHTRTCVANDTTSGGNRRDTMYTSAFDLRPWSIVWFQVQYDTRGSGPDTNWTADTIWVDLQTSSDALNWTTYGTTVGTVLLNSADLDSIVNSTLKLNRDSVYTGNWARFRFVYGDEMEGDEPGILGNVYRKIYKVFLNTVK